MSGPGLDALLPPASSARRKLGRTSLQVSQLGLGTAPLGGLFDAVADSEASAVVDRALAYGLRLFDTAPLYGCGLAEERLGRALRAAARTDLVVASKVGRLLRPTVPVDGSRSAADEAVFDGRLPLHPVFDYTRDGVLASIEESLQRLGLDRLDIVHVHDPHDDVPMVLEQTFPALAELRAQDVIGAIGVGMDSVEQLSRFAIEADFDCFLLPGRYTLLEQVAAERLLPLCLERSIAVIIGGVYNSGILADPYDSPRFDYRPAPITWVNRAQKADAICRAHGVPLKAAAIQFPLGHPSVASVLTGSRSVKELEENVAMFELAIPAQLWDDLRSAGIITAAAATPPRRAGDP